MSITTRTGIDKRLCPLPFRKSEMLKLLATKRRRLPKYGTCSYWFSRSLFMELRHMRA